MRQLFLGNSFKALSLRVYHKADQHHGTYLMPHVDSHSAIQLLRPGSCALWLHAACESVLDDQRPHENIITTSTIQTVLLSYEYHPRPLNLLHLCMKAVRIA